MKLIRTKGRGAANAAKILAALEQTRRRGARHGAARSEAHRRRRAPQGRSRAAALCGAIRRPRRAGARLRVKPEEMAAAWDATDPALRDAFDRGIADPPVRQAADADIVEQAAGAGLITGQIVRPLGSVGCYVPSGRHPLPSTLLMTAIPAQVAGVERIVVCLAEAGAGDARRRASAWHHGVLSHRRSARHRRAGLWHGDDRARRQDRRPRQPLRHRGQAPCRLRLRHRYARRSDRNRRHQRAAAPPISPPISLRRPSTIPKRSPSSSPRARPRKRGCCRSQSSEPQQSGRARILDRNGLVILAADRGSARDYESHRARTPDRRFARGS